MLTRFFVCKTAPQLPANLPSPPKSIILLVNPPSATSLSAQALSPLTNGSTASVLAAVVDSVPGSSRSSRDAYSWLITDHMLPIRRAAQAQPTSLTLILPSARLTIPLANTLFENGQPATAVLLLPTHQRTLVEAATDLSPQEVEDFVQAQADVSEAWQELGELMAVVGTRHGLHTPVPAASIAITVPAEALREGRGTGGTPIYSRLPLRALTPPRQIEEGMGNILRRLAAPPSSADGTQPRGGASRELEAAVSEYIQSHSLGPAVVEVYARLTPQQPAPAAAAASPAELLLCPGASLHRVLSGGGGWGNKAGLLALDPQAERDVAGFERELAARLDGDDEPHGAIVQPGAWAQFFVVEPAAAAAAAAHRGIQIGAAAKAQHTAGPTHGWGPEEGEEKTLEGVFGGASELGVDVSVAGKTRRMDVPGGVVIVDV